MSNTIQIKRSNSSGNVPASLAFGELAINTADQVLYSSNGSAVFQVIGKPPTNPTISGLTTMAGGITVTPPLSNNVQQETLNGVTTPTRLTVIEGTSASPSSNGAQPMLWLQKYTNGSQSSEYSQTVGGFFNDLEIAGSGSSSSPTLGAWIGGMSSVNNNGRNVGTSTSPAYDAKGDTVGFAGFARNNGVPGNGHIITGLWGWAEGPTISATEYANLPAWNWSICGIEVNLTINSPDVGPQGGLLGNGSSVGYLASNYRPVSAGVMDWTFGMALAGSPNDGNYTNPAISDWNGFHTGILIDKTKSYGVQFGYYLTGYGIGFQSSYAGMSQRPTAGIYLGDTQMNLGQYTGLTFNLADLWANAGNLYYCGNQGNMQVLGSLGVGTSMSYTAAAKIHVNIGGTDYYLLAATSP
jgi:hypothetical protein